MSNFDTAVEYVLAREGGLSENPKDKGGITNYGISLRFLQNLPVARLKRYSIFEPVNEDTIRNLTIDQAKFIYRGEFWENKKFAAIDCQDVCNYFFDMSVHMGIHQATKLVQRSLCALNFDEDYVKEDGIFGDRTLCAINEAYMSHLLLHILVGVRASYYCARVEIEPNQRDNLNGWLSRAYQVC